MKRLLISLFLLVSLSASAQTLETVSGYPTGYTTTSYYSEGNTIRSIDGVLFMVYEDVPVVLVKHPAMNTREEYEVPSTVRRIQNNAFQGTKFLKTLKIHSTVTYGRFIQLAIGESAFNDSSIENFEVIEDSRSTSSRTTTDSPTDRKEISRHDLNGRQTTDTSTGVQLITYDDNTTKKVLK